MNLSTLSDEELIRSIKSLTGNERSVLVSILKHLTEFENRRLSDRKGFPSLFDYCVRELRYAQGESLRRIRAARASKRFEVLYGLIRRGTLSLTTVALLEPHLKWNNYRKLIRASKGLSTREVEALISSLNPIAAAPVERIRILTIAPLSAPAATTDELFPPPLAAAASPIVSVASPQAESPPAEAAVEAREPSALPATEAPAETVTPPPALPPSPPPPAAVRRAYFSFTADEAFLRDFERAKELSRHRWPAGRQEEVFAGALKVLLEKIDPGRRRRRRERARRLAAGARSRGISRAVKDEVWERDGGRCVYPGPGGGVCGARAGLEFDHVRAWAKGGSSDAANIRLLCRSHNDLEARRVFGAALVDAAVARRRSALRKEVKI